MNEKAFHYYFFEGEELIKPGKKKNKETPDLVVCYELELSPSERDLLSKILQAIQVDINHIKEIDLSHEAFHWGELEDATLLSFGPLLPSVEQTTKYQFYQKGNSMYLHAHSLTEISGSVDFKQKLWKALKAWKS